VLVVDEFALEAPDEATARWYYETLDLLAAVGRFARGHAHGEGERAHGEGGPLRRWRDEHHHDEPLHPGAVMRAALAEHFSITFEGEGPYLYRYLAAGIAEALPPGDPLAGAAGEHVLGAERRGIAAGRLKAVGLRLVATAP
jgi:hypothetical protein